MKTVARVAGRLARTAAVSFEISGRVRQARAHDCFAPADRARILKVVSADLLAAYGVRLEITGTPPRGPVLFAANHLSWLDPLVVMSAAACIPTAKQEIARWPVIGGIASSSGVQFVQRGDALSGARLVRSMTRLLEAGASVLNFPEGTTTDGRSTLPFKPGSFGAARHAAVPIIPVTLSYDCPSLAWTGAAAFVPHYLKLLARERCTAVVRFGAPIDPRNSEVLVARLVRAAVDDALTEVHLGTAVGA